MILYQCSGNTMPWYDNTSSMYYSVVLINLRRVSDAVAKCFGNTFRENARACRDLEDKMIKAIVCIFPLSS